MRAGSLLHLVWGSMRSGRFSTLLTIGLTALSLGLSLSTLGLKSQAREAFLNGSGGYDAVLGVRGSALQLVLSSVFFLEISPGNLPWSEYEKVAKAPGVKRAYPLAMGDSFSGYRVVGTVPELLTSPPESSSPPELAQGRVFDPVRREAVIGSEVARRSSLALGKTFQPTHGLADDGHSHDEEYVVSGVLFPTNGPLDRVILVPLEGVLRMEGHVLRGHDGHEYHARPGEAIPDRAKEVSAVLLDLDSPQRGLTLSNRINREESLATLAFPVGQQISEIFNKLGWAHQLLTVFAVATIAISSGAILATLWVAAELRRRDYALLRALGLSRSKLWQLMTVEGMVTVGCGAALSLPVAFACSAMAASWVRAATGLSIHVTRLPSEAGMLLLLAFILGGLAGAVPGWRVYRRDLADQLDPESL